MKIIERRDLERLLTPLEIVEIMRQALAAQAKGQCDTPMPMHLNIPERDGEVHIKSSYRRGGKYFALKMASTFGNHHSGMMMLCSVETGAPVALLADEGHLTDVRTAAVAAMVAKQLKRRDTAIGIVGTGVQARLQAQYHAAVLDLREIWIWGRNQEHAKHCARDIRKLCPAATVRTAESPAALAGQVRLIVTTTASRAPLLKAARPGTHISAVGSDSPGKQELDPGILRAASLVLVDSRRQCEKLGELQHARGTKTVEIGALLASHDRNGITVCDMTGLGVEDLYIAEYCYTKSRASRKGVSGREKSGR